jgi:RimJ/RimL family protein N-acetyltransferase
MWRVTAAAKGKNVPETSAPTTVATAPGTAAAPPLTLRRWTQRDVPALVAAHRDPAMLRWLVRHIYDEGQAKVAIREYQEAWEAGTRYNLAIVEHAAGVDGAAGADGTGSAGVTAVTGDGAGGVAGAADAELLEPIGSVSIRRLDKRFDIAEVGYWVVPSARGRSIAPRAMQAALDWAVDLWRREPLRRFELIHTVGNEASCRVAQKLGFAFEQELPPSVKWPEPGHLHVRPFRG